MQFLCLTPHNDDGDDDGLLIVNPAQIVVADRNNELVTRIRLTTGAVLLVAEPLTELMDMLDRRMLDRKPAPASDPNRFPEPPPDYPANPLFRNIDSTYREG